MKTNKSINMKKSVILLLALIPNFISSFSQTGDSLVFRKGDFIYRDTVRKDLVIYIPSGDKVYVSKQETNFYEIKYKSFTGWISKNMLITESDYLANKLAQQKTIDKAKADKTRTQNEAIYQRRTALTKKYGSKEIAEKIMAKKIWLGMTSEMAIESWGRPSDINKTVGSWGVHEQWVYRDTYLYFENGVLTSWQE
jgi:hypothetical protein